MTSHRKPGEAKLPRDVRYGLPADDPDFIERLQAAIAYNHLTGRMYWRTRQSHGARKGEAGCTGKNGYVTITFEGRRMYGQHVAWAIRYGVAPEGPLTPHGRRNDLRIDNWEEKQGTLSQTRAARYQRYIRAIKKDSEA